MSVAAGATGLAVATALLFFFPAIEMRGFGHLSFSTVDFMPLWRLRGHAFSEFWLGLELFLAGVVGAFVWFVYPDYDPAPPRK